MAITVVREKQAISKFWNGVRNDRSEGDKVAAVKEICSLPATKSILAALESFISDADSSEVDPARTALRILSTKMHLLTVRDVIERTAVSHPIWQIQSRAQDLIWQRLLTAMIAACE